MQAHWPMRTNRCISKKVVWGFFLLHQPLQLIAFKEIIWLSLYDAKSEISNESGASLKIFLEEIYNCEIHFYIYIYT